MIGRGFRTHVPTHCRSEEVSDVTAWTRELDASRFESQPAILPPTLTDVFHYFFFKNHLGNAGVVPTLRSCVCGSSFLQLMTSSGRSCLFHSKVNKIKFKIIYRKRDFMSSNSPNRKYSVSFIIGLLSVFAGGDWGEMDCLTL